MRAFISYSSTDRALARRIAEMLRTRGFDIWIDEGELGPGDSLASSIASAIGQINLFVVILTKYSVSSKWVKFELEQALNRMVGGEVKIAPLRFDDSEVPEYLKGQTWGDVRTDEDLVRHLNHTVRQLGVRIPMPPELIKERFEARTPVRYGLRLVPSQEFREDGFLGPEERRYVFIGDYAEQCGRSLRQILSNLWMGDAFEQVSNANLAWTAVIFEIGDLNRQRLGLMPATWKAIFRILSSKNRLGMFSPSPEERKRLGPRGRDYYEGDQEYWFDRITSRKAYEIEGKGKVSPYEMLKTHFGYDDNCFDLTGGTGIAADIDGRETLHSLFSNETRTPSRLFLVNNAAIAYINCRVQELGHVDDGLVLV